MGATYLDDFNYWGYGIYTSSFAVASSTQNYRLENCFIAILISRTSTTAKNELINCGFYVNRVWLMISFPYINNNNTVNGKTFKNFYYYDDNLMIQPSDADNYGQMLFFWCDNLSISHVIITEL